jgi:exopolysaccharide biosynthesis protein
MVTVDGRQPGTSVGMNLQELAEMLLELGAVDAMNLDGGGSTTMFVGGKVINQPSDKEGERKVSDAILVFPRQSQTPTLTIKK